MVKSDTNPGNVDDTPDEVQVPERSEEEQAQETQERDEALAKDRETFK
jgi:hypothetical protein